MEGTKVFVKGTFEWNTFRASEQEANLSACVHR